MAWARRVDGPHGAIVKALRRVGCQVADLSRLGSGVPDLLVRAGRFENVTGGASYGKYLLMEVKRPGGKLKPRQVRFMREWPEAVIVESVEDALAWVGIRKIRG